MFFPQNRPIIDLVAFISYVLAFSFLLDFVTATVQKSVDEHNELSPRARGGIFKLRNCGGREEVGNWLLKFYS